MTDQPNYCGVLLAAGRSTRFGSDKLLQPLADGVAIAVASARALQAAMEHVVVVVDRDNQALQRVFEEQNVEIVFAPDTDIGMGTSLAAGIAQARQAAGWVIALADMPFIRPATIRQIRDAIARGSPLAAPAFRGRRGHPVGFGRKFFDALLALRGDEGARHLVALHRKQLELIECEDGGVVIDVDHPQDLPAPR